MYHEFTHSKKAKKKEINLRIEQLSHIAFFIEHHVRRPSTTLRPRDSDHVEHESEESAQAEAWNAQGRRVIGFPYASECGHIGSLRECMDKGTDPPRRSASYPVGFEPNC